jgi:hypothetical protein
MLSYSAISLAEEKECGRWQIETDRLWAEYIDPFELTIIEYNEVQSSMIIDHINSQEPKTNWGKGVGFMVYNENAAALIINFNDGCSWYSQPLPHGQIDGFLREVFDNAI